MKKLPIYILTVFLCLFSLPKKSLSFGDFPEPIYGIERVESKTLIIEHHYDYWSQVYKQPLIITKINKSEARYDTPEQAFTAFQAAMESFDLEWFVEIWDKESQGQIKTLVSEPKKLEAIKKSWKEMFANSTLRLLRRIDRSEREYVIFEFQREKGDKPPIKGTANFRKQKNLWKATNQFSSDPISNYLDEGVDRIKVHGE